MQSKLFKFIFAPALLLAAAFTTNALQAETVNVPFNFTVNGQACPSGLYRVVADPQLGSQFVKLAGVSTRQSFRWNLRPGNPAPNDTRVILRFSQDGTTHALESIQYGSGVTAKLDHKSHEVESLASLTMNGQ